MNLKRTLLVNVSQPFESENDNEWSFSHNAEKNTLSIPENRQQLKLISRNFKQEKLFVILNFPDIDLAIKINFNVCVCALQIWNFPTINYLIYILPEYTG